MWPPAPGPGRLRMLGRSRPPPGGGARPAEDAHLLAQVLPGQRVREWGVRGEGEGAEGSGASARGVPPRRSGRTRGAAAGGPWRRVSPLCVGGKRSPVTKALRRDSAPGPPPPPTAGPQPRPGLRAAGELQVEQGGPRRAPGEGTPSNHEPRTSGGLVAGPAPSPARTARTRCVHDVRARRADGSRANAAPGPAQSRVSEASPAALRAAC